MCTAFCENYPQANNFFLQQLKPWAANLHIYSKWSYPCV